MSKIDSKATNRSQHLNLFKKAKAKMYIASSYHWQDNAGLGSANKGRVRARMGTCWSGYCALLQVGICIPTGLFAIREQLWLLHFCEDIGEPFWLGLVHYQAFNVPSDVCTNSSWLQNSISHICGTDPPTACLYLLHVSPRGERKWVWPDDAIILSKSTMLQPSLEGMLLRYRDLCCEGD